MLKESSGATFTLDSFSSSSSSKYEKQRDCGDSSGSVIAASYSILVPFLFFKAAARKIIDHPEGDAYNCCC